MNDLNIEGYEIVEKHADGSISIRPSTKDIEEFLDLKTFEITSFYIGRDRIKDPKITDRLFKMKIDWTNVLIKLVYSITKELLVKILEVQELKTTVLVRLLDRTDFQEIAITELAKKKHTPQALKHLRIEMIRLDNVEGFKIFSSGFNLMNVDIFDAIVGFVGEKILRYILSECKYEHHDKAFLIGYISRFCQQMSLIPIAKEIIVNFDKKSFVSAIAILEKNSTYFFNTVRILELDNYLLE